MRRGGKKRKVKDGGDANRGHPTEARKLRGGGIGSDPSFWRRD